MAKTGAQWVPEAREQLGCVWAHRAQLSLCHHLASCPGVQLGTQMRPEDGSEKKSALFLSLPPRVDSVTTAQGMEQDCSPTAVCLPLRAGQKV